MHLLTSSLTAQLGGKDAWKHSFSQDAVGLGCSGPALYSAQPASFQRANPAVDPLPPQAPAFMGAALPAHQAFLTILTPSCRLSPISHGNTIALFFRSLLPNYTVEVCGVSPQGASLRLGVGPGGLAQTSLVSTGGATGGRGARGSAP